jgi:ABC-type multidrug transport system ATPase subunit
MAILEAKGVNLRIAGKPILEDISLDIQPGEVLTILGANGAGKSSLVKILTGLLKPCSGSVHRQTARIGYVPQKSMTGVALTVSELMQYFATIKKCSREEVTQVLSRVGLLPFQGYYIRELSGGYRQRLTLAQALLGNPELLILDEPFVGLDQDSMQMLTMILRSFVEQGGTLSLTTHMLSQPFSIKSRVALIEAGRMVRIAPYQDIVSHVRLRILCSMGVSVKSLLQGIGTNEVEVTEHGEWVDIVCAKQDRLTILTCLSEAHILRDFSEEQLWQSDWGDATKTHQEGGEPRDKYA